MNQHIKAWLLMFLLSFSLLCCSVSVFATEVTPEQVEKIIAQQEAASKAAASKAAASGSVSAASSKRPVKRTYSSAASSDIFGEESGIVSGEESSPFSSEEESSEIILPSVGSVPENNPLSSAIVDPDAVKKTNWIGIISWILIALGVIVVLIVVFSNRHPPSGGSGRKRYRRPNRSRKKHLLSDKYYRNMKY